MKKYLLLFLLITCSSCNRTETPVKTIKRILPILSTVEVHEYVPMSIPDFFTALINNHQQDYLQFAKEEYIAVCKKLGIDETNEENLHKYFTIKILHDLLTSQAVNNCATGQIWNIPYYWHWIPDNPRHEIYLKSNKELLKDLPPAKGFSKYQSYADIDRTPYLFLSDLFAPKPKYYSDICGDFSTFGWCSEREMAFISLVSLLNFKGKVKAEHGHSWSELIVPFQQAGGTYQQVIVEVDNTFDMLKFDPISKTELKTWERELGDSKTKRWYNKKALSKKEQQKIKEHIVSSEVMAKLERKLVAYLNGR